MNRVKDRTERVCLRIALRGRRITVMALTELIKSADDNKYKVSKETMEILSKNKLIDSKGNIRSGVLKAIAEMRGMAVEIPELCSKE